MKISNKLDKVIQLKIHINIMEMIITINLIKINKSIKKIQIKSHFYLQCLKITKIIHMIKLLKKREEIYPLIKINPIIKIFL